MWEIEPQCPPQTSSKLAVVNILVYKYMVEVWHPPPPSPAMVMVALNLGGGGGWALADRNHIFLYICMFLSAPETKGTYPFSPAGGNEWFFRGDLRALHLTKEKKPRPFHRASPNKLWIVVFFPFRATCKPWLKPKLFLYTSRIRNQVQNGFSSHPQGALRRYILGNRIGNQGF